MGNQGVFAVTDDVLYQSVDAALRAAFSVPQAVLARCDLLAPGQKVGRGLTAMDWVAQNGLVLAAISSLDRMDVCVLRAFYSEPDINDSQSAGARVELGFWLHENHEPDMDKKFLCQHVMRHWSKSSKKESGSVADWAALLDTPYTTLASQRKRVMHRLDDMLGQSRERARAMFIDRGWIKK